MQKALIQKISKFKLRQEKNLENFQPEGLFCARNTNNWKWGVYWEVLNNMKLSGITSALLNVRGILPIMSVFLGDCLHLLAQSAQTV